MCGRFTLQSPSDALAELFEWAEAGELRSSYNVAPTQRIPVFRENADAGAAEIALLRWGLIPFFAKDASIGARMINARSETIAEKPSFRNAYRQRRCLVLADGFYEWRKEGEQKTPYLISLADGSPFAFAGLWENWTSKESDETIQSTALITTAANDYMSQIHHRMPIILQAETAGRWLDGDNDLLGDVSANSPEFRAWPVGREVNNARNEKESLIDQAGDPIT